MAKSRFEYVRNFEIPDPLIPETFIVVRIDGRGFHKFSEAHNFEKPNDIPALDLMNRAARAVMDDLPDVVMGFGESDEFSFLIRRQSNLYNRRRSKINSTACSIFTSAYVFYWNTYLPDRPLRYPPTFDSRVVLYPSAKEVRDYFSWRQADKLWSRNALQIVLQLSPHSASFDHIAHINNLYNTCFWCLVKSGLTTNETNKALQGTDSKDKNELLFSGFGINYNKLPEMFRKGSILVRQERIPASDEASTSTQQMQEPMRTASNGSEGTSGASCPEISPSDARADVDIETQAQPARLATDSNPSRPATDAGGPVLSQVDISAVQKDELDKPEMVKHDAEGKPIKMRQRKEKKRRPYEGLTGDVVVLHVDIIGDQFWSERPWLVA